MVELCTLVAFSNNNADICIVCCLSHLRISRFLVIYGAILYRTGRLEFGKL